MNKYLDQLVSLAVTYAPRLLGALVVLIVGLFLIKFLVKWTLKLMKKKNVDQGVQSFVGTLIKILLQILLWIVVLGMVGVQMASLIALLGAVAFAIGMALTGTLQNFAAGVLILILKPFKVGDFIESQGIMGTVKEIQIFSTKLLTPDNRTIIVPNSQLSNATITNYTSEPLRRVDWTFGIGYEDDFHKAKAILEKLIAEDERILKEPEPFIALAELGDSSVNITTRAWVKKDDYWNVFFDMNLKVFEEFNKNGINIPYPQMDVHLYNVK